MALTPEEEHLIRLAIAGDKDARGKLYIEAQGAVYRICNMILNNPARAEEVAQDSFVKAFNALNGFRFQCTFRTWVKRIARRESLRELAHAKRRP